VLRCSLWTQEHAFGERIGYHLQMPESTGQTRIEHFVRENVESPCEIQQLAWTVVGLDRGALLIRARSLSAERGCIR